MRHKGQTITLEERIEIVECAQAGQSSRGIADELLRAYAAYQLALAFAYPDTTL